MFHKWGRLIQAAVTIGVRSDDVTRVEEELPGMYSTPNLLRVDQSLQATP